MPLIERYILRRTTQIFFLTLCALTGALWVTQVLRQLDVITSQGQAIWTFLVITFLAIPGLVQAIAPIAFLTAAIVSLNSLTNDSELPVIAAAGASRTTVHRPILVLAVFVTAGLMLAYHIITPASLGLLREVLTRVRADMIATLIQDGGFHALDARLTIHIREKAADGTFRDIFVSDDRNPDESLQYSATRGVLIERPLGSFMVLQDGDLVSENRVKDETRVIAFETYALDLSQVAPPSSAAIYHAKDRSTLYLLNPPADDEDFQRNPKRITFEIHNRMSSPLYTLGFAFLVLAFLGRPRTNRQDRTFAVTAVVFLAIVMRSSGFAAAAITRSLGTQVPLLYVIPICGIAFGFLATFYDARLPLPRLLERSFDRLIRAFRRPRRGRVAEVQP